MVPLPEPRVTLTVEGTPLNFLVDTGAEYSVLQRPLGKLSTGKTTVFGATGQKQYSWTTSRTVDLGKGQVTHSFLVIPECPTHLLGRDLLTKLKSQIQFTPSGPEAKWEEHTTMILALKLEEYRLHEQSRKEVTPDLDWWLSNFP